MPGINLLCDFGGRLRESEEAVTSSSCTLCYDERYQNRILLKGERFVLGFTAYPEYPFRIFEIGDYWFCIEGKIYDKSPSTVELELAKLVEKIFSGQSNVDEELSQWLLEADGDFVIVIFHTVMNQFVIFNDSLGRLQLYYSHTNNRFTLSREIRYVVENLGSKELDRFSIAQYLLFSYTLGKRTLFKNVYSLAPASLLRIDLNTGQVTDKAIYVHNFDLCQHHNQNIKSNSNALAELFSQAVINRCEQDKSNVVSLSGGLDSRTVCAGLKKNNLPFSGATFLDHNHFAQSEFKVAEQLTKVLGAGWHGYRLAPPRGETILKLLRMKYGMNWLGMSFMLPFYDMIREDFGANVTYLSGDGGGETMHSLKPIRRLKSAEDVIEYVSNKYPVFLIDIVTSLVQVSKDEFLNDMSVQIDSYPETTFNRRYAHFMVFERNYKWAFEGEDRNRHYFWSTTPFYSIHFFKYAMNCPEHQKYHLALYGKMMSKLSPAAATLGYANKQGGMSPVLSNIYALKRMAICAFPALPSIKRKLKKPVVRIDSYPSDSNWLQCLRNQIELCSKLPDYLEHRILEDIVNNSFKYSRFTIENLFTITSLIDFLTSTECSLNRFYNREFV